MTKLYITTQYTENYGSDTDPYWKSKGSYDYFVLDVYRDEVSEVLDRVRSKIEHSSSFCHEHIIGYRVVPDDFITRDEEMQMEYDGKITFPTVVVEI